MRLRCPNSSAGALEAVIINTAGGIVGGDSLHIDLSAHEGAHVTVTTAAAEKVYRSLDSDAAVDIKLKVGSGAVVAWLPQETILFDQARLQRTIDMPAQCPAAFSLVTVAGVSMAKRSSSI